MIKKRDRNKQNKSGSTLMEHTYYQAPPDMACTSLWASENRWIGRWHGSFGIQTETEAEEEECLGLGQYGKSTEKKKRLRSIRHPMHPHDRSFNSYEKNFMSASYKSSPVVIHDFFCIYWIKPLYFFLNKLCCYPQLMVEVRSDNFMKLWASICTQKLCFFILWCLGKYHPRGSLGLCGSQCRERYEMLRAPGCQGGGVSLQMWLTTYYGMVLMQWLRTSLCGHQERTLGRYMGSFPQKKQIRHNELTQLAQLPISILTIRTSIFKENLFLGGSHDSRLHFLTIPTLIVRQGLECNPNELHI